MRALAFPVLLACAAGCAPGSNTAPSDCASCPPAAPPTPAVVLPHHTRLGSEPGLCTRWSSVEVDLSSLGPTQGNDYTQPILAHAVRGGFSVVAFPGAYSPEARIAAIALDTSGDARAGEVDLPPETNAALADAIGTPDGGWIAAWTSYANADSDLASGEVTFVRYDATGVPVGRSNPQQGASQVLLGAETDGSFDVAWATSHDPYGGGASWAIGRLSANGATFSSGEPFGAATGERPLGWRHGQLLSLSFVETSHARRDIRYAGTAAILNGAARSLFSASLPERALTYDDVDYVGWGIQYAPASDARSVIVAQSDAVTFLDAERALVVPSDLLLNGASPWPAPSNGDARHVVVAFADDLPGAAGGASALEIVELSSTGVRGPVGTSLMTHPPPEGLDPSPSGTTLRIVPTLEEDAYLVLIYDRTSITGAVFSCQERAS